MLLDSKPAEVAPVPRRRRGPRPARGGPPQGQIAAPDSPDSVVEPFNAFSAIELQAARERLNAGDGLHRLLSRIGGDEARDSRLPMPKSLTSPGFVRRHRGTLATVIVYILLAVIPGLLLSIFGTRITSEEFVMLTDWREFPGAMFLYLVLAPVIWTFYLWQPRLIIEVFDGLARSGAIGPARRTNITADGVLRRIGGTFVETAVEFGRIRLSKGVLIAVLAAAASVATLLVWPPTAVYPFSTLLGESDIFWWKVVPAYFWAVWLPLVFVNVYMLVWIVVRQTVMIANIQRLLRLFKVEPIPFHPDRCSGFAPIGSYATNIVRVALIIGGWALILLISGPATGHGIYIAPHTLFLVLVQVLLTPYLLLGPVWYAHRVMDAARDRALQRVGDAIRTALLAPTPPTGQTGWDTDSYEELESKYRLMEVGFHTWPFGRTAFSGVSITAGLTLLGNIVVILYRIYGSS